MKKNPSVYIIILQYNHSEATIECLESLSAITYHNVKFVVIDNASKNEHLNNTRLFVSNKFGKTRKCKFIANGINRGYGAGNNVGIKYALDRDADYVIVLNNDTVVQSDFVEPLLDKFNENISLGIVQPVITQASIDYFFGGPLKWLNIMQISNSVEPDDAKIPELGYCMGSCIMLKGQMIDKIGLFDERYFMYFEDVEYSFRSRANGYELSYAKKSKVKHNISTSASSLLKPTLLYYDYRNLLLFMSQYAPIYIRIMMYPWLIMVRLKQYIKILFSQNEASSRAILGGIDDYNERKFGKNDQNWN